jgi:heme-degrading monooxygenase HmoA
MILEHALLTIRPGRELDFEAAFVEARPIISTMPGFRKVSLSRGLERPGSYLLLVEWERLEDHLEGFRHSPQFEKWKQLLHHFYDPAPMVEHYAEVLTTSPRS